MLSLEKKERLENLIKLFSKEEIIWTSGYLSGLTTDTEIDNKNVKAINDLTFLYISETGNSKFLANELVKKLKSTGANTKIKAVEQYRLNDFQKEKNLVIISSTHGEGEIPQSGIKFYDYINKNNLDLSALNFMVIALGDKNYPKFCQAGKDIESRLEELKAKKISTRIDLDLDFENFISQIFLQITEGFSGTKTENSIIAIQSNKTNFKTNFTGTILENINLNDVGSTKETHHIEITTEDEINYEAGDSVGILFSNDELKIEGQITPRLYSIASSKNEHGNEVHLTVSLLRYLDKNGKEVKGLFSWHLSQLNVGGKINFYISRNRQFKLPDDEKDIIMVGPGTGIAPFRSFVAERNYRNAKGKNWLFFGERNFQTDFLYQTEWQSYLESGLLTKLDVAFSRDQKEKIYVQDRIRQNSSEIYHWLEKGAYFYICGDKENMARDVENTLLTIIESEGKKTKEQAQEYLSALVEQGRYLKDVY
jgi:sulfite reductase (NADPH) flavoprotein alpha-component